MQAADTDGRGVRPVFVVGVPRSGTTWVQLTLSSHPQAWPLLETYMFSRQIGLGALLRSLPAIEVADDPYGLPPAGLGRLFERDELVRELRAIAERWLRSASDQDARFVIEKSPWHLADIDVIAELLPEARFVHVVRDGRDVTVSLVAARRSWSEIGESGVANTVREAGRLWSRGIQQGELARSLVGDRMLELRYEDAHADRRAACRRLFEHCGMPYDEERLDRAAEVSEFSRRQAPSGEDRPLRGGRVGDWRERFGMRDAWTFDRLAGDALRETGYEPDRRWWLHRPLRSRL